jgi:hypothetical protein
MGKRSKNGGPARVGIAKSARKNSSQTAASRSKKGRAIADPMPQIIARISQQGKTRNEWDTSITNQLAAIWLDRMPPADLKIASAQGPLWLARMSPEVLRVLDEIIVRQAGTLGWRIGLGELVQWRLSEWELVPDGLKLLRRYHRAVERAARIFQRREKPPLDDPDLYRFKVETVNELRVLLSEMRDEYQARFCDPPDDLEPVLVAHFVKAVAGRSKSLPFLAANCASWQAYLKEQPTVLRLHLAGVRLRPASLFDSWFSWCKGVSDEWLRQTISRLGSSLRKPIRNAKL